jgi:hypothetical protein
LHRIELVDKGETRNDKEKLEMIVFKHFKFSSFVSLVITLFLMNWGIDALAYQAQSNSQNKVRVDVRPVQLIPGKPAKFEIRLNTHSGNLSQDLVAVCTLKDDSGREYRPTGWDGSPPGGHHRRGVLEFPALGDAAKSITLVIREVANVPERVFNWSIER